MNDQDRWLTFYCLLALTYPAFAVVAGRRRGPGRGCVAAAGFCGFAGTLFPIAEIAGEKLRGRGLLGDAPEQVLAALIVLSFSGFAAAQVLLVVGLLRAWRAREALPQEP